ncbi:MAG: hypothetical protein WC833_13890 [Bacteroidales bacterium]|jgi:hypothetical protein
MSNPFKKFFAQSDLLDYMVLRPLSHINMSWEMTWDRNNQEYEREPDTFASLLIDLTTEISKTTPPAKYHDNEDCLAEYVKQSLNWKIHKQGNRWVGFDYESILEQGGFKDLDEKNLVQAATGRVKAALDRGQLHFDDMEESHRKMLAAVMAIIIYHRSSQQ